MDEFSVGRSGRRLERERRGCFIRSLRVFRFRGRKRTCLRKRLRD